MRKPVRLRPLRPLPRLRRRRVRRRLLGWGAGPLPGPRQDPSGGAGVPVRPFRPRRPGGPPSLARALQPPPPPYGVELTGAGRAG